MVREYTVKAYAAREQVSTRTIRHWIFKHAIEARHVRRTPGGQLRILVEEPELATPSANTPPRGEGPR